MRNHRFSANIDELLPRDEKKKVFSSLPAACRGTGLAHQDEPHASNAGGQLRANRPARPTGSCSILEQCRSGQGARVRAFPFRRKSRDHSSLSCASLLRPRAPTRLARVPLALRELPQDASRTPLRMAPTDLSHFPPLRDAGVMKRASPRVLRLEKRLLTSPEIPWTSADKSS